MGGSSTAPFGSSYVFHRESVTTKIQDLRSGLEARLKKLKAKDQAEDSVSKSPAIGVGSPSETAAPGPARATDRELAEALARFGWKSRELPPAKTPAVPREEPEGREEIDFTAIFRKVEEGGGPAAEAAGPGDGSGELSPAPEPAPSAEKEQDQILESLSGEPVDPGKEETHVFSKKDTDTLAVQPSAPLRRRTPRPSAAPTVVRSVRKPKTEEPPRKEAPAVEYRERDYMPVRRRRSYRTGLRGGLMYFGFVICVSAILASLAWLAADDVLSLNKDVVEAEVYVGEDRDMSQVASELASKGVVRYKSLFLLFARLMKAETKVEPGVYTISSRLDYNAMIHAMQQEERVEERSTVKVTIPEGKTLKQTFQILAEHGVCPYETLLECSAGHDFGYDFLEELPYGEDNRLEGFLFPDTYEFFAPSQPEEAIDKFLSNFDAKMNSETMLSVQGSGYSLRQILTIASLIEMEAGTDAERPTIASVIYNRLNSSSYPYLQIDATIQYALEERKTSLTNEDLEIDSPYNTYKYTGLPPGPITNPGMASIRAALEPESTGYYFYALNKHGSHNFFTTMSQFEYFVYSSDFGG